MFSGEKNLKQTAGHSDLVKRELSRRADFPSKMTDGHRENPTARRGGAGCKGRCRGISSRIVAVVRLAVLCTWTDRGLPASCGI
jgi:hypothetical protein